MLSVPVLLLGKPLYLYWLFRGGKGMRRRRVRRVIKHSTCLVLLQLSVVHCGIRVLNQGYERVRRVSEDDNSITPSYEDDEEEGQEELTSREALPKVRAQ